MTITDCLIEVVSLSALPGLSPPPGTPDGPYVERNFRIDIAAFRLRITASHSLAHAYTRGRFSLASAVFRIRFAACRRRCLQKRCPFPSGAHSNRWPRSGLRTGRASLIDGDVYLCGEVGLLLRRTHECKSFPSGDRRSRITRSVGELAHGPPFVGRAIAVSNDPPFIHPYADKATRAHPQIWDRRPGELNNHLGEHPLSAANSAGDLILRSAPG